MIITFFITYIIKKNLLFCDGGMREGGAGEKNHNRIDDTTSSQDCIGLLKLVHSSNIRTHTHRVSIVTKIKMKDRSMKRHCMYVRIYPHQTITAKLWRIVYVMEYITSLVCNMLSLVRACSECGGVDFVKETKKKCAEK